MYKHGAYGSLVPTQDTFPPSGVATIPVYIGTAPVQQLSDRAKAINKPILINSFDDAKSKIGYDDNWDVFTLCEVVYAHFKNRIMPIGPMIVINVLDPTTDKKTGSKSVSLTNKKGYIDAPVILSTIEITDKVKDTDYTAEYTIDGRILITDLKGTLGNPVTVSYSEIDISKVADTDIIGGMEADGTRLGLRCIELINQMFGMVPSILAAPGWSQKPTVAAAMITSAQKINGHWDTICVADVDSSAAKDIDAAIAWIDTNLYRSNVLKVGWPKAKFGEREYWLSTLMALRMQQTDYINGNVPFESPSNKTIEVTGTVLADGTEIFFDEVQANELNASGITTINYRSGNWVLWGPHMSNFKDGDDNIAPEDMFDCSVRMGRFLMNTFQRNYALDVDKPLNRSHVDTILNDAQTWLNSLIADGKMLYGKILFLETSNPVSSIVKGDFKFDIKTTYTPAGKSLTFQVQYTNQGLNNLTGGENA